MNLHANCGIKIQRAFICGKQKQRVFKVKLNCERKIQEGLNFGRQTQDAFKWQSNCGRKIQDVFKVRRQKIIVQVLSKSSTYS